jgi:hypothetical protein
MRKASPCHEAGGSTRVQTPPEAKGRTGRPRLKVEPLGVEVAQLRAVMAGVDSPHRA